MMFLALTLASLRDQGVSRYEQGLFLLTSGLGLLMVNAEAAYTLKGLKLGFMKLLDYLKKDMLKSTAKYAYFGRCNVFLFFTTLTLIVATVLLYWAVTNYVI